MADPRQTQDIDPIETKEWITALDSVIKVEGPQRAITYSINCSMKHAVKEQKFHFAAPPLMLIPYPPMKKNRCLAKAEWVNESVP